MKRLDYIDSLRGIAIIMVIIVHTTLSVDGLDSRIHHFLSYGQMGVQLFFIVSAITLCMSYSKDCELKYSKHRFFVKRYFRIAPLYYFGIIIYFCTNLIKTFYESGEWAIGAYNLKNVAANALFINDFFLSDTTRNQIVHGGWSIGTEMTFYLVFPMVYFYTKKSYKYILLIIILSFFSTFLLRSIISNKWFIYQNIINMISVFMLGIAYFKYLDETGKVKLINNKMILIPLFLISFAISITSYLMFHDIYFTPLLAGISFIFLIEIYKNFPRLNFNIIIKVGKLSYSMYMFHFIPAWYFSGFLKNHLLQIPSIISYFIMLLIVFSTTYIFALISERLIEKKGVKLGRKLIEKFYK